MRAGINTHNIAVSADGKYTAVDNYLPHTLVLLDTDLNVLKIHQVVAADRKESSGASRRSDAAPQQSFVAAAEGRARGLEISWQRKRMTYRSA
ncbi:MAG: hypothetical protein IPI44_21865 [Sulfuritalea sp.]|nr:hypothetical protein [Sulfuritalea sp.]